MSMLRTLLLLVAIFSMLGGLLFTSTGQLLQQARRAVSKQDSDQALRLGRRVLYSPFSSREEKQSALSLLAITAYRMSHPKLAIEYLDQLLEQETDQPFPWLMRGRIHQQLGQMDKALNDLDKGFSLIQHPEDPALIPYYTARAYVSLSDDQSQAAMQWAHKGLALNAQAPGPHLLLSELYQKQGKPKLALAEAERAYSLLQHRNSSFILTPEARKLGERLTELRIEALQQHKRTH